MKAVQFESIGRIRVTELPEPEPGPGEVLIRVAASGICHTDVDILKGNVKAQFPVVPGHEYAGTVVAVGEGVSSDWVGRRVAVNPNVSCGQCRACHENRQNLCRNLQAYGVNCNGGFAELSVVRVQNVHPIGNLPFEQAAFAEPLGCVIHALRRLQPEPGCEVLIFGAGPMGLLMLQALKAYGAARVAVVDIHGPRLEVARQLGADEAFLGDPELRRRGTMRSFDVVADATGVPQLVEGMMEWVRDGGKLLYFGVCPPSAEIAVRPFEVYRRDLEIVGSFSLNATLSPALRLIESGAVQVKPLLSHQFALDEFEHYLNRVGQPDTMKLQARIV